MKNLNHNSVNLEIVRFPRLPKTRKETKTPRDRQDRLRYAKVIPFLVCKAPLPPCIWNLKGSRNQSLVRPALCNALGFVYQNRPKSVMGVIRRVGRLGGAELFLDGLGWQKLNQRTYY